MTDELRRLTDDMFETMYAAKGIGLAAPQIGRTERIAVVDIENSPIVIVNPEIILTEGSARGEEGCLSIPEVFGDVDRALNVTVRALDRDGQPFELEADGMLAVCIQHETEHLEGKVFVDHLSALKRQRLAARLRKRQRLAG